MTEATSNLMPGNNMTPENRSFDETKRAPMKPFSTTPNVLVHRKGSLIQSGRPSQSMTVDQSLLRGKRHSNQIPNTISNKLEQLTSIERVSDIYKAPKILSQKRVDGPTPLGMHRTFNKTSRASLFQEQKNVVRPPSSELRALQQ